MFTHSFSLLIIRLLIIIWTVLAKQVDYIRTNFTVQTSCYNFMQDVYSQVNLYNCIACMYVCCWHAKFLLFMFCLHPIGYLRTTSLHWWRFCLYTNQDYLVRVAATVQVWSGWWLLSTSQLSDYDPHAYQPNHTLLGQETKLRICTM